jgi:hypothetical protein
MDTIRHLTRSWLIVVLAALSLAGALAVAPPARAATFTEQCDISGYCPNFYGGGFTLRTYTSGVANNNIQIQSIPPLGYFQLLDKVHGGCIGDVGNNPNDGYAQGGLTCNSTSTGSGGDYGTRDKIVHCTGDFGGSLYANAHWGGYIGFNNGDNNAVVLNAGAGSDSSLAKCLRQEG